MTPEHQHLIESTWQQVVPIADTAATLFYERLFQLDPDLGFLFAGTDMGKQKGKLVEMLSDVVGNLDHLEDLLPMIAALGRRHVDYGVEAHHYDLVGQALLDTLATGLGEAWSDSAAEAWAAAYGLISTTMQDGAATMVPQAKSA
jgi:hemoglobin-like flavoprotein